jgi:5-methylcytosine-specific restriction protein A
MRLSHAAVAAAMTDFDRTLRASDAWRRWESNRAFHYAILYEDRKYPVKQIVSMASSTPVAEFSGGNGSGQANRLVESLGFQVVSLRDNNPDWIRDELVLALDVYLRHRPNPPGKDSEEIAALSRTLRALGPALFPQRDLGPTFRNANGVYMKLMNLRRLDPQYTQDGRKGLQGGSRSEEAVWQEYADRPEECARVAAAIAAGLSEAGPGDQENEYELTEEAPEGRLLTRLHVRRERNRKLVESKRRLILKQTGKLACEVCGFDFAAMYGDHGKGFIECHHSRPLHTLQPGHKTKLSDLILVCSNCHRMIHRSRPWLTKDQLRVKLS